MDPKYENIGEPAINVIEEASEVIKAVTKIERFGAYNFHPDDPNKITNIQKLREEWFDLWIRYCQYISYISREE